jgi:hypothetical protein
METICIYCRTIDKALFKGREHVIPQSFGTFGSETPVLNCVCDECNAYFAKALDQPLARDTLEGVTRYRNGIISRENTIAKTLQFTLRGEEHGEFDGALLGGVDPKTGHLLPPVPQCWIFNIENKQWEVYTTERLENLVLDSKKYGSPGKREFRVIAASQEEHDNFIEKLNKLGISYKPGKTMEPPAITKKADENGMARVTVGINGEISNDAKRALAKILFNFAAYHLGLGEVLQKEWNKARQYIRFDKEAVPVSISNESFWNGQETEELRFASTSYNLRIENDENNVVGTIQMYNIFTYRFILAKNHIISKEVANRFTPGEKPIFGVKGVFAATEEDLRRILGFSE